MRIGLIIQDLASEYSNSIVKGTKKYCLENDIQLFIFTIRSKTWNNGVFDYQHYACRSLATKYNVDGILLVTNTYCQNLPENEHESLIKELSYVPLVSFGAEVDGLSSINANMKNEMQELLEHLEKKHNCKNIYFMGAMTTAKDINARLEVYKDFMKKRNQTYDDKIIYAGFVYANAIIALDNLKISLENLPFDAIVCMNDDLAFGCIDYLRKKGIRVPEDVKITGFDNQLRCNYMIPTLTSIDPCIEEQCYEASRVLCEEIKNPNLEKRSIFFNSKVIYRKSCGCFEKSIVDDSSDGKYFQLREQVFNYQYFLQDLQSTVESEKIKSLIIGYYKYFGIKSCVCCIYDHPRKMLRGESFDVPEKAKVFFAYNDDGEYSYDDDFFINPTNGLYPTDFKFEKGKEIVVTSLFSRDLQYGYMIYTPGEVNYNIYEIMITTTGFSLATNIIFSKKIEETEKLSSEKKHLETETYFDEMTGVLNRRGFFKYAEQAMKSSIERGLTGGILFGDMDRLKYINDKFGHSAGDSAIKGVVEILKNVFRNQDLIARIGGDEFVIFACGLSASGFKNLKNRLKLATEKYNSESRNDFEISISIGYVEFNEEANNLNILLKQADENQYKEKVLHHKNRE